VSAKREIIPRPPAQQATGGLGQLSSSAVRGGEFIFVSGLTAIDPRTSERAPGTVASETRNILGQMSALLEAAGSSLAKVVKVNVFLHSMLEAPNMNEVYAPFFPGDPPARTVCGAQLPGGCKVVIECTALA
jgi:2-iminobutanoate/2-iminopropanoate deaminase